LPLPGSFTKQVFVEELHPRRAHQAGRQARRRGVAHEGPVLRDTLPIAIVLEEPAASVIQLVLGGDGAGLGDIALDPLAQRLDPVGEDAAQASRPVALITLDLFARHQLRFDAHLLAPPKDPHRDAGPDLPYRSAMVRP
jgi:hypothetical protein